LGGVISEIDVNHSFVETSDINDINYVSEGFLTRYRFDLNPKSTGFFNKLIKAVGVVIVLAAAVVATIFTCGAAGVAIGAAVVTLSSATLGTVGLVAAGAIAVAATTISAQTIALKARSARNKHKA
jgi:hypothetical protein